MKIFEYKSRFAPYIYGLIEFKRSDGFKYECDAWHLSKFDAYCTEFYPEAGIVTRKIADGWCTKRKSEGSSFLSRRINVLRQLCIYMTALGIDVYVPKDLTSKEKPILTIPTHGDIMEFFEVLDSRKTNARTYRYIYAYQVMFRFYYCCGMRLSEARLLKREDIDLERLTITIRESKGHKDRLIYLPENSSGLLSKYVSYISSLFPHSPYIFPAQNSMDPMHGATIDRMFRACWSETDASRKYAKPPTVHCLRHAFVVDRINRWATDGIDFQVMLPYLSRYLGHSSPAETYYYYHMVESAFSTILERGVPTTNPIPEVIVYEE